VQLRETLPKFDDRGIRVGCVVQGTAEEAARFCGRHGVQQVCIPDPARESYRAMSLERGSWWKILLPTARLRKSRASAKAAGCGISLEGAFQKHSDILQLPGAALVARDGKILWLHRGTSSEDLPSPPDLLATAASRLWPRIL
jgi:alkyl-hydroperoxide reductase/thiol specific antioxidant family protein